MLITLVMLFVPSSSLAHEGHDHGPQVPYGRIPHQPDFERIGDTTYRYLPWRGEYEVEVPGEPPSFAHWDHPVAGEENLNAGGGGSFLAPTGRLKPPCRGALDLFGSRVVVVYAHALANTDPAPVQHIREVVEKINWTFRHESVLASGGAVELQVPVECDASGEITVKEVITQGENFSQINSAVTKTLGSPEGYGSAVKYLVFDKALHDEPSTGGVGVPRGDSEKSPENSANYYSSIGIAWAGSWDDGTPLHELVHAMNAVKLAAPFATSGFHCTDGVDIMCYIDGSPEGANYTNTRCPSSQLLEEERRWPLDCGGDTYFDPTAEPGEWLSEHWNVGEPENVFLLTPPESRTTAATEVGAAKGTINGTVNPKGIETSYYFQYGPTTAYGSTTASKAAGSGSSGKAVSELLTGLQPETTYHYRLVAKRSTGTAKDATVFGEDQTVVTTSAPWSSESLGGYIIGDPDVSSWGSGRLDVFALGADGSLMYHRWKNGAEPWSSWEARTSGYASGPGAVSWGYNRIDMVAAIPEGFNGGGKVAHEFWDGSWHKDILGGSIIYGPDISSWGSGRLDVFGISPTGTLMHKWFTAGAGWSGWESRTSGYASAPGAVSWGPNRIDVVARLSDGTVAREYWDGSSWKKDNLAGSIVGAPDIASSGPGHLDVFARGADGKTLMRRRFNEAEGWTPWEQLGTGYSAGPGAVFSGSNRLDVFGRATDGSLKHEYLP